MFFVGALYRKVVVGQRKFAGQVSLDELCPMHNIGGQDALG